MRFILDYAPLETLAVPIISLPAFIVAGLAGRHVWRNWRLPKWRWDENIMLVYYGIMMAFLVVFLYLPFLNCRTQVNMTLKNSEMDFSQHLCKNPSYTNDMLQACSRLKAASLTNIDVQALECVVSKYTPDTSTTVLVAISTLIAFVVVLIFTSCFTTQRPAQYHLLKQAKKLTSVP